MARRWLGGEWRAVLAAAETAVAVTRGGVLVTEEAWAGRAAAVRSGEARAAMTNLVVEAALLEER